MVLIIETPKKVPLILGNSHILSQGLMVQGQGPESLGLEAKVLDLGV